MPETPEDAALVEAMLAAWHLGGDDVSMGDGMRAVLALVRENIAQGIDDEADVTPCAEDATVTRGVAQLVRVGFSYDAADAREEEIATLTASLAEAEARAGRADEDFAEAVAEVDRRGAVITNLVRAMKIMRRYMRADVEETPETVEDAKRVEEIEAELAPFFAALQEAPDGH